MVVEGEIGKGTECNDVSVGNLLLKR
jgi:hypothetical protein